MKDNHLNKTDTEMDTPQYTTNTSIQVPENTNEYRIPLNMEFVDYKKIFDSIKHEEDCNALEMEDDQAK